MYICINYIHTYICICQAEGCRGVSPLNNKAKNKKDQRGLHKIHVSWGSCLLHTFHFHSFGNFTTVLHPSFLGRSTTYLLTPIRGKGMPSDGSDNSVEE